MQRLSFIGLVLVLFGCTACGGGGGSDPDNSVGVLPPPTTSPPDTPPPSGSDGVFDTAQLTSRFLTQATFGPRPQDVARLTGGSASAWLVDQFGQPPSLIAPVLDSLPNPPDVPEDVFNVRLSATTIAFWRHAVTGPDQLRQRMAFALSQLLVVSNFGGELLTDLPEAVTYYEDILLTHAFGNYRDLLEAVTYSPAMGHYLTYMGNKKANPVTGSVPDENYARELLQLFTVGLVELSEDGTPVPDISGKPRELYSNKDITELAKVFTGLELFGADPSQVDSFEENESVEEALRMPMVVIEDRHSQSAKAFLDCSIPAGTDVATSIDLTLDCIVAHPNTGPFIGRQLIQRFTTSDPSPAYVARVARTFASGTYTLPDGAVVGTSRRGDLQATLAAILFDAEARDPNFLLNERFGKIREPVLRFTHWARAFNVPGTQPELVLPLYETEPASVLNQHPYRSRSVFNFYRPGYVAPGTGSGSAGMTAPELQIVNATSTTGYINFMSYWALNEQTEASEDEDMLAELRSSGLDFSTEDLQNAYVASYTDELALANDPDALIEHLNQKLLYGSLSENSRTTISNTVAQIPMDDAQDQEGLMERVGFAVLLVMTSPDYLVQR